MSFSVACSLLSPFRRAPITCAHNYLHGTIVGTVKFTEGNQEERT